MGDDDSVEREFELIMRLAERADVTTPAAERIARLKLLLSRGAHPTHNEFLTAFRAARDEQLVPPEAGFYLVAYQIMSIADERDDPRLEAISDEIDKIERAHGLGEDEYWPIGEGPDEYQALSRTFDLASDAIKVEFFRALGEQAMAALFEKNRAEFNRRFEAGRRQMREEMD